MPRSGSSGHMTSSGKSARTPELLIECSVQSNLLGFSPKWRRVISEMFNNDIGSSLDFPNLYSKVLGGAPETFNDTWLRRYQEAREAGIDVGVIAVLNSGSLDVGADEFYGYYIDKLGMKSFQVNTPYPGGLPTPAKRNFPLDDDLLSVFYTDLFDLWMLKGRPAGVSITPFDQFIKYFRTGGNSLSCCFGENCANTFLGIDPKGNVSQCEGFAASYPEQMFGNILACQDMAEIMNGPVRKQFLERPSTPHGRGRLCGMRVSGPLPRRMSRAYVQPRRGASSRKIPIANRVKRSSVWRGTLP